MSDFISNLIGPKIEGLDRCDQDIAIDDEVVHIDTLIDFGEPQDLFMHKDIGHVGPFKRILQDYETGHGLRDEVYIPQPRRRVIDAARDASMKLYEHARKAVPGTVVIFDFGSGKDIPTAMVIPSLSRRKNDGDMAEAIFKYSSEFVKITWAEHCMCCIEEIRNKIKRNMFKLPGPEGMPSQEDILAALNDDRGWALVAGHVKIAFENIIVLGIVVKKLDTV